MVITRGWGILAVVAFVATGMLNALFGAILQTDVDPFSWQIVPAGFIAGAGLFFVGRHLNVTLPERKFAELLAEHNGETMIPGIVTNYADPTNTVLAQEEQAALKRMKNRHTFFFVPLQWCSFLIPMICIALALSGSNN